MIAIQTTSQESGLCSLHAIRKSMSPKFIEIWKPTETSVTEFCYKKRTFISRGTKKTLK